MPAEAKIPKSITPWIAVLSLVVQESDTVAGVSRRLKEQFRAAHFPESSAHNNIRSLAGVGYLRLVEEGSEPTLNRYEATTAGDEVSRRWLLSSLTPMMRDPLQGKLSFVGYEQIDALIELVRAEEQAFRSEYERLQVRCLGHKRFRDRLAALDCQAELQAIKLKDEAEWFGDEVMRRKKRARELEELLSRLREG
jgi:DNA-binding PadR family transcriptional regulator